MLNSHFPPHYIHICQCWKMHTNNLLLFFGVCLSILELLGFKYCKWIIYICTVYNFQVHEMDYQQLILVMKKKNYPSTLYIKSMWAFFWWTVVHWAVWSQYLMKFNVRLCKTFQQLCLREWLFRYIYRLYKW